jgi:hypothetical protein
VVFQHLGSEEEEGRPTHRMAEMVEPGKTVKRRECIHGMKDLTGETNMASVVEQQFRLKGVMCLKMRVRHKEMNDHDATTTSGRRRRACS